MQNKLFDFFKQVSKATNQKELAADIIKNMDEGDFIFLMNDISNALADYSAYIKEAKLIRRLQNKIDKKSSHQDIAPGCPMAYHVCPHNNYNKK